MDPHNTAVLAIHWQRDIVRREGAFGEFYGEMVERSGIVERTVSVLASARERGVPIFYTRVCFSEGHPELVANSPLLDLVGQRKALVDGSPGASIIPELSPQPEDVVVNHTRVAGTQDTNLIEQLHARDIKSVAILGVSTNISVESTARNLADAGFDVYVVADCCTTTTQAAHDASIETLGLLTRKITSADELTAAFSRRRQAMTTQATTPTLTQTEVPTPERILQLGLGFWGPKTLLSAVELGVFTELAQQEQDVETLRTRLGLHPRSARDFFDALVALGMLDRDGDRYRTTPATALFLDRAKPSYIGGILEMANARLYPFWASLTEGLRTGQPQNEAKTGGDFFDVLYQDPDRLGQFLHSMTGLSMGAATAIAQKFPWEKYQTVIDIGCAEGCLPVQLALAHTHLTGGGLDLPSVEPHFNRYVAAHGLADRQRFYAADFFQGPLPNADVLVMGHVLHDWTVDERRALISKAYEALPWGGALIVYDAIIDDERRQNAFGLLMSLNMLIETPGGFDYTGADCQRWLRDAGFRQTYVEHLAGPDSMVVGIK